MSSGFDMDTWLLQLEWDEEKNDMHESLFFTEDNEFPGFNFKFKGVY